MNLRELLQEYGLSEDEIEEAVREARAATRQARILGGFIARGLGKAEKMLPEGSGLQRAALIGKKGAEKLRDGADVLLRKGSKP